MKSRKSTVFIVELFILFIILLVVIVTITALSVKTRDQSIKAGRLTEAVVLAENTAEITSGAGSVKETAAMIGKMDDTGKPVIKDNVITARVRFATGDESDGNWILKVTFKEEKGPAGRYISKRIRIISATDNEQVYDLDTGKYVRRDRV